MATASALKDLRHRLFYWLVTRRGYETVTLGGQSSWTIHPAKLNASSVVYSAGVGHDISFEKQLVATFGCVVHLLDPSPTGIATMGRPENQHANLRYEPCGLAESDRTYTFSAPAERGEGSFSVQASAGTAGEESSFPCVSLPTLMRRHGHTRIELLKMDIEGFEYDVLRQICEQRLPVGQICVEYHHALLPGIARSATISSILALRRAGFRLIHRTYWDHTFVQV